MPVTNTKVKTLEDLAPVIELYHHMVRAGNLDEALKLFYDRLATPTYFQFGAYQLRIELLRALFLDGEDKPPHLKRDDYQAFALNEFANAYSLSGQPRRAVPLSELHNVISKKESDKEELATGLGNVADDQFKIGALSAAESNLRLKIEMKVNEFDVAVGHRNLGYIMSYRGAWQEAEQELDLALKLFEKQHVVQSKGIVWSYRALRFLLMAREEAILDTRKSKADYRLSNPPNAHLKWQMKTQERMRQLPVIMFALTGCSAQHIAPIKI